MLDVTQHSNVNFDYMKIMRCERHSGRAESPELMTSHEATYRRVKVHFHRLSIDERDPTRNRVFIYRQVKVFLNRTADLIENRAEDHQETPLQDRFTNDCTLLINIRTHINM